MRIGDTPFIVDKDNADHRNLAVDVEGLGTVYVTVDDDKGELSVALFPFHVVDGPLATCKVSYDDLVEEPEEEDDEDAVEDCTALNMLLGHSPEEAAKAARGDPEFWGRRKRKE